MTKILATIFSLLLVVAFNGAAKSSYATISFTETDHAGRVVRELKFMLTDKPANTCISGNWKEAKVIVDKGHYALHPAYTLEKGQLEVLLVNTLCDSYDSYTGILSANTFAGEHVAYGLGFSKSLGKVSGAYSEP